MNYKQAIQDAIDKANQKIEADRKIRDEALAIYYKREAEENEPVNKLIGEYLDFELKDGNGTPIREGCVITNENGYSAYKVISRGMQVIFGTPLFNPRIEVLLYSVLERKVIGKKAKSLFKSDLNGYFIVFDDSILTSSNTKK